MKRAVLLGMSTGYIFAGIGAAIEALWLTYKGGITFGVYNEASLLLQSFVAYGVSGIILGGLVGVIVERLARTAGRSLSRSELIINVAVVIGTLLFFAGLVTYLFARALPHDVGILDIRGLLALLGVMVLAVLAFFVIRWLLFAIIGWPLRRWLENLGVLTATAVVVTVLLAGLTVVHHSRTADRRAAPNREPESKSEISSDIPNVILITLDTVRAHNLNLYGYERETVPNLTELAQSSVVYERAVAHSAWTLPSHQTLFTGRYPSELSEYWGCKRLRSAHITLTEVLDAAGYRTGAVVAGPFCSRRFGFGDGFDFFEDTLPANVPFLSELINRLVPNFFSSVGKRRASQNDEFVFRWLDKNANSPFFLFINHFDAHCRLNPVYPFRNAFAGARDPFRSFFAGQVATEIAVTNGTREITDWERDHWITLYDSEILTMDHELGRLFDKLKAMDAYDNTLLIVTSDHGHSYGEHGLVGHDGWLFEDVAWVPLIIRYPGGRDGGTRVANRIGLVDIFSLILGELGLPIPESVHSTNRATEAAVTILENGRRNGWAGHRVKYADKDLRAIYEGPFKLVTIDDEIAELYNLTNDPGELQNLIDAEPETVRRLEGHLALEVANMFVPPPLEEGEDANIEYEEKLREQLRALGYIK
ncbi:MAG: sulfatase-like hydrolase/transferase [Candidatus Latescibacterota bacterium]|nr:MAG: sulfatase-like hydrolase/transferase [Candidatus Latescibacterota bacterium]